MSDALLGPVTDFALYDPLKCRAWSKTNPGKQCGNYPIKGAAVCKFHGAGTKAARKKAAEVELLRKSSAAAQRFGLVIDTTPSEALLDQVRWTAGHVEDLRTKVQALTEDEVVWGTIKESSGYTPLGSKSETVDAAALNMWYQLYIKEREFLVRVSEAAVRAGVEQRRVELAEQQGLLVAVAVERILNAMHDAMLAAGLVVADVWEQAVQTIVPRELRAMRQIEEQP